MSFEFDPSPFTSGSCARGRHGVRERYAPSRTRCIPALALALVLSLSLAVGANAQTIEAADIAPVFGATIAYGLRSEASTVRFTVESVRGWRWRMRFVRMSARLERARGEGDFGLVSVDIDAQSVESNTPFAAAFVKSAAVLDAARYPSIRFTSTRFIPTGDGRGRLLGSLTIRAVTRPIELYVTFDDSLMRAGARDGFAFSADGNFSRTAFGLAKWAASLEDNVQLQIEGEFAPTSPR